MVLLLAGGPRIVRFKCPGCRLTVQGTAFEIQIWSDEHCSRCFEERARVHPLTKDGRIRDGIAPAETRGGGLRIQKKD